MTPGGGACAGLLAIVLALTAAAAARADDPLGIPVVVGNDGPGWDACASQGRVVGLNPLGDNFLAVRTGPSTRHVKVDEVYTGDTLHLCEKRGRWWGVVYAPSGEPVACGVTSGVPAPQAYGGPCRSGWVHGSYVELYAG
ncbi:SH3 domain-containing protein [Acuticoccus sp.]|uniref:SH3 domain-containing protein n=1 Tax=Acuticoccus sp. TaxID=1904378 RepID=UPI003B52EE33